MDVGARAVQKILLDEFSAADLIIIVVWLRMYEADSLDVVHETSKLFSKDSRVSQFYDPEKLVGMEVAKDFGANVDEVAWDVYLFYNPHSEWTEPLPLPTDWIHQLESSSWADPTRLFMGNQLTEKLREIMEINLQSQMDV